MEKVIIYAKETCPYCKEIKDKLKQNKIDFKVRFTNEFEEEWQQVILLTSMPILPTICYEDEFFIAGRDFNSPDHLVNILKTFKRPIFDRTNLIYERLKTLNYNISLAFTKLDSLLTKIEKNTDEHKSTS
tara:strand:- start:31 stop:420 length:390 start_codon:yes stop_codon:yes gene_type:complete